MQRIEFDVTTGKSSVIELSAEEVAEKSSVMPEYSDYDDALIGMFNKAASAMGYTSWETCALRAYKPGPFSNECTAFFDWVETCNTKAYAVLADYQAGKIKQPTMREFLGMMPPFKRPDSV